MHYEVHKGDCVKVTHKASWVYHVQENILRKEARFNPMQEYRAICASFEGAYGRESEMEIEGQSRQGSSQIFSWKVFDERGYGFVTKKSKKEKGHGIYASNTPHVAIVTWTT